MSESHKWIISEAHDTQIGIRFGIGEACALTDKFEMTVRNICLGERQRVSAEVEAPH